MTDERDDAEALLKPESLDAIVTYLRAGKTTPEDDAANVIEALRARLAEAEGLRERYEIADWCNEQSLRLYHDERIRAETAEAENARLRTATIEECAAMFVSKAEHYARQPYDPQGREDFYREAAGSVLSLKGAHDDQG